MRVTVRFVDGEQLEGNAQRVDLDTGGFTLMATGGNTRSIWVGAGAIKYVAIHPAASETYERDPRDADRLPKLVLHFLDGEIVRTFQDEAFAPQPGGFAMRLWDPEGGQLVRALVSGSSLKGLFTVEEWDSRSEEERQVHAGDEPGDESEREEWVEQEPLLEVGPQVEASPEAWDPAADPEQAAPDEPLVEELRILDPQAFTLVERPAGELAGPVRGDQEERRATFGSGLTRRGKLLRPTGPEQERHNQLRERISRVLGSLPPEVPEADEEQVGHG